MEKGYLHNPIAYWLFAQSIRLMLLPVVLPVRLYEYFVREIGFMESWEANTFVFITAIIGLMFLIILI